MSAKVLNKMMGFLGMEDEIDEFEEFDEDEREEEKEKEKEDISFDNEIEPFNFNRNNKSKVVNIHTATSTKVVIVKPTNFEQALNICDNLKNRKIVVVNTTLLDQKVGQRLLDFIGGASYVLEAELQEVEKGIYLLSPSNVEVNNSLKDELSSKGVFSFIK